MVCSTTAFRIYGVAPGEYFVSAALQAPQQMMIGSGAISSGPVDGYAPTYYPGPEWGLKAVLLNGTDVTDTPLEFVPGKIVEGLQVVFTRKRPDISGLITNERNVPDTDATVIRFSQDSARWNYMSRFLRTARPSQDGRYSLRGLPPDDYFIVAVKDIETGQWHDPEFLESVRAAARRISLGEGERTTQDLKVVRP